MQFTSRQCNDTLIGNYMVSKTIGEGTFGKVKLGIHEPTGQKVAIKILEKEKIVEHADMERITREISILKQLRHPHIIQLYEIIQSKKNIYLIMEYAEGGELFDHIVKKKRIEEADAVRFMQQILSGVEYLHSNLIAHRDLKPENLLLDFNKDIKIVDFGLSNQYKVGEKLTTACGSPCYAAPEMIAGKNYLGPNADIWSCGIIMYALLCGYLPFEDPNTNKLYKKILSGHYEVPKGLSRQAQQLLRLMLNVNPEERYTIDQIRKSRWYNIVPDSTSNRKGITVGREKMELNYQVISQLSEYNIDGRQAVEYLEQNRHNSITATYYLLLRKFQRSSSDGTIYKPAKQDNRSKLYDFMAKRREKTQNVTVNQSLTLEQIRNALMQKKQYTPTARLDFDPKIKHSYHKDQLTNSLNWNADVEIPRTFQPRQTTDPAWLTNRAKAESVFETTGRKVGYEERDDLEQIKKYQTLSTRNPTKRIEFGKASTFGVQSPKNQVPKLNPTSKFQPPSLHSGPFNLRAVFKESAQTLMRRIQRFLSQQQTAPFNVDNLAPYTLSVMPSNKIWIESLQHCPDIHLVMFNQKSHLNQELIKFLQAR